MDIFRRQYTELNQQQRDDMNRIKEYAEKMLEIFDAAVPKEEKSERSRCMAIARTNLETTVMWAVKAVTTKVE